MTKNIYILFLLALTFIIGPTQSYASPMQETMACCMDMSMDKSCCSSTNKSDSKEMSCKGKCESITCTTYVVACTTILVSEDTMLSFSSIEQKKSFFYREGLISSDFHSIWQPPKIG